MHTVAVPRSHAVIAALVCSMLLPLACADSPTVSASGDHAGLTLRVELSRKGDSLFVVTTVRNTRAQAVHLDADQCGRVTEAVLVRTVFEPEGATYAGSLDAVKQLVLHRQRFAQHPDRFEPRRVTGGRDVPECVRPERPVTVEPGKSVEERWELPFQSARGLDAVGSEHTIVRAEAVEAVAPDRMGFLDIVATGEAEEMRKGRNVIVEQPTSAVLQRPASTVDAAPSLGQLFDRAIEHDAFRDFIVAQPTGSWRHADLLPVGQGLSFEAVTTGYERALIATFSTDGRALRELGLPGVRDRTRDFPRRRATLPPGIALIPTANASVLTEDLIADPLELPSGQVVADGALAGDVKPFEYRAAPGSYPVHVTLARYPGNAFDDVALASLVVSDAPTVEWKQLSTVGVDGGVAGFTSAEGAATLGRLIHDDTAAWESLQEAAFASLTAHDHLVTEYPIDGALDLVMFSTGFGDGGYPVFVGLDGTGQPTRFVIDFSLVRLDWPSP
jgi:hypothetical protein